MTKKVRFGTTQMALQLSLAIAAPLSLAAIPDSTQAQSVESTEGRLRRLEAELRAVQRKVFPEGAGKSFSPEIVPPSNVAAAERTPAATAVSDLLARMDAVEAQLQRLIAANEEMQNQLTKLDGRVTALDLGSKAPGIPTQSAGAPASPSKLAIIESDSMPKPVTKPVATATPAPGRPSADRVAAVQAIEKPLSDDKGEDEYGYGYRLWEAKFFPEAQQQLLRVVQQFPKHKRISYTRNLLGRSYLDDGKPGTAAPYFVQNYQANPKGERAADSLLYLAVAMARLKETKRACVALGEFRQVYPLDAIGRLKSQFQTATKSVTCN
jgi:TolA-binding protein